jgi:hypothetical protein
LTNFKRRPRQPSLLRMVHQTTDVEDNDLGDDDFDDLDLDDFHPGAESTPLHVQRTSDKEPGNDSGVQLSSSSSRGTKRKITPVVQVPRSSPPYDPPSGPDVEESRSSSPSLPELLHSTEENRAEQVQEDQEILSQTMAPPLSSSDYEADEPEVSTKSPARTRSKRRTEHGQAGSDTEIEVDVSSRAKKTKGKQGKQKPRKEQAISTAKLQALLPRRRTKIAREADEYDVPSEEDEQIDSDEDELALPPRRRRAATRKASVSKPAKSTSRTTKKPPAQRKPAQRSTRTYGRRGSSDKENAQEEQGTEGEFDTVEIANPPPSANLDAIAKKFEEVDAFEMEFESVSYVQTSSSPYR